MVDRGWCESLDMGCNLVLVQKHSLQTNVMNTTASCPWQGIEGEGDGVFVRQGRGN